jgi:LacI family transcriptional regulator
VVGVDNSVLHCEFAPTALTSVQPDTVRVGYEAAAMLEGLMGAGEGREVRVAPLGVVGRRSTARLLYGDEDVDRAMRFLRGHAARSITVQDIADELSVGRRSLERKFRRLTGGTPDEALRRVRLESAAAMLVKSDASMLEVASACGFSSQSYFSQAFRRAYGTNPGEYRERAKREGRR